MSEIPNKIKHVVFDHDGTLVDMENGLVLFPNIEKLLNALNDNGIKIYVWTARDRHSTINILKSLDILPIFEDISTATDSYHKPDPEALRFMLGGVDPRDVIHVGDSGGDMDGAKKYGAVAIGAIWDDPSARHKTYLEEYGADHVVGSVEECEKLIMKLIREN